MRQGQQHNKNRSRGRGGGNRGGGGGGGRQSNPLNRVFESNGPDVKVRGNAQTIADKYLQLARDAISSGENVSAENYFQHAEHYLRIVAAAQAFNQQNQQAQQAQNQQRREDNDSEGNAASGNAGNADGDKEAASGEDGGAGDNNHQSSRRGNRGQRGNGRQRPTAADGEETATRSEEARDAASSEGDDNWQSQAPDFLRRETGERDGNAGGDGDDAPAEVKPKRQSRARKAKPVKAADTPSDEQSADGASAVSSETAASGDASEDVSAA